MMLVWLWAPVKGVLAVWSWCVLKKGYKGLCSNLREVITE